MGFTGQRGERRAPSASRFRRFPAASRSLTHICKGAVFSLASWSLSLPRRVLFHTFYFFIRPLKRTRAQGRVCSTGLRFYKQVREASVVSVTESTLLMQILLLNLQSLVVLVYAPDYRCCFFLHLPFCHLKSELAFSVIYICGCARVCH